MKSTRAPIAGIAGALAMSAAMFIMRQFGVGINIENLLGSLLDGRTNLPPFVIGLVMHVLIGAVVAYVYAFCFEVVQTSGVLMGGGLGLAHGLVAGLFMSGIPAMNPLSGSMSGPGAFLSHFRYGPLFFLLAHVVYGATVALVYGPPIHRPELHIKPVV